MGDLWGFHWGSYWTFRCSKFQGSSQKRQQPQHPQWPQMLPHSPLLLSSGPQHLPLSLLHNPTLTFSNPKCIDLHLQCPVSMGLCEVACTGLASERPKYCILQGKAWEEYYAAEAMNSRSPSECKTPWDQCWACLTNILQANCLLFAGGSESTACLLWQADVKQWGGVPCAIGGWAAGAPTGA